MPAVKAKQAVKCKIKKGDEVILIAGKDKGKRGKVKQVKRLADGRVKLLVEGVNMVKKHVKPNPNTGEQGGVQSREAFLDVSNVKAYNTAANKGDRIGYRVLEDGKKVRYYKSTGDVVSSDV